MSKHFGKTWWGQQWLHALSNIDFSNRLPRGSSYARKGAVQKITIQENKIEALVRGSRPKPYKVTITLPLFSDSGTADFMQQLIHQPGIISKLLNRELDPALLDLAKQAGLKVFPSQWRDFEMNCSCPDWAVPCKHLAAVIYKVCSEIDNNPFLVFELHGVDLVAAMNEKGLYISTEHATIRSFESHCRSTRKKRTIRKDYAPKDSFQKLSFGKLSGIQEPLIALLEHTPAFYQGTGDFKEKYKTALKRIMNLATKAIGKIAEMSQSAPKEKEARELQIGKHSQLAICTNARFECHLLADNLPVSFESMSSILPTIHSADILNYQPSTAFLYHAYHFSLHLLASGSVVPQIISTGSGECLIRWLPAMLSKHVRDLVKDFSQMMPPDFFEWQEGETSSPIDLEPAVNLLSLIISSYVADFHLAAKADMFMELFFLGEPYGFDKPGEEAISGGIQKWLQRYYLSHSDYKPQIIVIEEERQPETLFKLNMQVILMEKGNATSVSLDKILKQKKYNKIKFEALKSLSLLSHLIKGLDAHINSNGATDLYMDNETFTHFLMQMVPIIQLLNIDILLPKSLQSIIKPKPSVSIKTESNKSFLKLDQLLAFDWQVAVGDTIMSEAEFKKLLKHADSLIKYKSQYIYVSREDLQKLYAHFSQAKELSPFELLRAALSGDYMGAEVALTKEVTQLIREITETKSVALPEGIHAKLRPYQQRGFSWLYRNAQIGFGSVIADDMGLGKTLQVITALLKYKEEGLLEKKKVLVVAPTGLLSNWMAEIEKFAPSLKAEIFHGPNRSLDADYDILLTSYGVARSDAAKLKKHYWHSLIIDEAQNIKNQNTRQAKAIKSIQANNKIAMSGTPVENRLSELWSILDFSNPGILGSPRQFQEAFGKPIETFNDDEAALKLKKITAPFMMRRLKTDKKIISDLPDKLEMDCFANLVEQQASLYESTLQEAMKGIEAIDPTDSKLLFARRGLVLQLILALKQICNHPTQFLKNNLLDQSQSGKIALLFDKLDSIAESGEKVLIFTQFAEMGKLLQHFITERYGETPLFYHGGCTIKQRKSMTEAFQNNNADKVFILSLKAAGTGLNLTAASHVIHYDLWWNPAVEAQATDRAYRIGQQKNVMVHRFITKNTFEERINDMIQSKKALAGLTVSSGENWIGNLNNQELKEIFEIKEAPSSK